MRAEAAAEIHDLHEKLEECYKKEQEGSIEWQRCLDDWTLREMGNEEYKKQLLNEKGNLQQQLSLNIAALSSLIDEVREKKKM